MNFDTFIKRYGIEEHTHIVAMERETLLEMLSDLYNEAYNDGADGEKLIRLKFDKDTA